MQLEANEVHIWSAHLMTTAEQENEQFLLLSPDERERALRFHFPIHKKRFIAARATLRQILSVTLTIPAEEITFTYSEHEKPSLLSPKQTSLQFNLSHSGDMAVYALNVGHAIGVDIERVKDTYNQAVAEHYFSSRENADLIQLAEEDRARGFYRLWSRKEAIIKAVGKGLTMPLSAFSVSINDELENLSIENETWSLLPLAIHPAYQSALASKQAIKKISYWSFLDQSTKLDKVSFL
jgi:4'-phosphopantetheinyl transferase